MFAPPKLTDGGPRQLEEGWVHLGRFYRMCFLHPVVRIWGATSWSLWVSVAPNSCNPVVGGHPPTLFFKWMRIKWPWGKHGEGIEMLMPRLCLLSSYYIFLKTNNSIFYLINNKDKKKSSAFWKKKKTELDLPRLYLVVKELEISWENREDCNENSKTCSDQNSTGKD